MASRNYKRDSNGRFASSGTAVSTTTGKAGGFANQQFRTRVQTQRQAAAANQSKGNLAPIARRAGRAALHNAARTAAVPLVATAITTAVGLRNRRRAVAQRRVAEAAALKKALLKKRAIVARPGGGGSKSGRPTFRYASSSIRPPSARLRVNTARRALAGRKI